MALHNSGAFLVALIAWPWQVVFKQVFEPLRSKISQQTVKEKVLGCVTLKEILNLQLNAIETVELLKMQVMIREFLVPDLHSIFGWSKYSKK